MRSVKDLMEEDALGAIDQLFLVKSCDQGASKDGRLYLNLVLADRTGTIDAKKWEVNKKDLEILIAGTVVRIKGTVINYRTKNQIKVSWVESVDPNSYDKALFIPTAPVDIETLKKEVIDLVNSIEDPEIKAVTQGVLNDNWGRYITYPAAVTVHQNYQTGLIFHSVSVCKVALAILDLYPGTFHRDFVIAGTLMHDIGKVQELTGPVGTKYTRIGNLESHIQIGAMIVNRKCLELNIDQEKTDLLTHILLSHHGKPEYGSPVVPKTADAFLVHLADDTDAKINVIQNFVGAVKPGEFTPKIPWMDNIVMYRPTFDKDKED